jgi:hypothetical protein
MRHFKRMSAKEKAKEDVSGCLALEEVILEGESQGTWCGAGR